MPSPPPEVELHHDVVVLRPLDDLDLQTAASLRGAALSSVPNDAAGLVLDLSHVRYLDSAGIRVLFAIANRLEEHRQRLALVVPPEAPIGRTLTLVDVGSRASLHQTVDAALADLRA